MNNENPNISVEPRGTSGPTHNSAGEVATKILHTLEIFPQVSSSMLQIAMNPLTAGDWRPVLEQLIREGKVRRFSHPTFSPAGRYVNRMIIQALNPKFLEAPEAGLDHLNTAAVITDEDADADADANEEDDGSGDARQVG